MTLRPGRAGQLPVLAGGLRRRAVPWPGDSGVTGELPSDPELLDFPAVEFRESGWDVKKLFKLMVESSTYRQSAAATPESCEKDPFDNSCREGRSSAWTQGDPRPGGAAPGGGGGDDVGLLRPRSADRASSRTSPKEVWEAVAMPEKHAHCSRPDHGDRVYRLPSLHLLEAEPPPASMDILNAPTREVCTVRRGRTNTPLQAWLVTLVTRSSSRRPGDGSIGPQGLFPGAGDPTIASTPWPAACWPARSARGIPRSDASLLEARGVLPVAPPMPRRWSPSASRSPTRRRIADPGRLVHAGE